MFTKYLVMQLQTDKYIRFYGMATTARMVTYVYTADDSPMTGALIVLPVGSEIS